MDNTDSLKEAIQKKIHGMDDIISEMVDLISDALLPFYSLLLLTHRNSLTHSFLVTGDTGSGKSFLVAEVVKATSLPHLIVNCATIIKSVIGESEKFLQVDYFRCIFSRTYLPLQINRNKVF